MSRSLRVTYLMRHIELFGGVKTMLEQATHLAARGHDVKIMTVTGTSPSWCEVRAPIVRVPRFDADHVPPSDLVIASKWRRAAEGYALQRGIPVHFCQGYAEFAHCVPRERPLASGWRAIARGMRRAVSPGAWSDRRRARRIERVFRLGTVKLVGNEHLRDFVEARFGPPCYVVKLGLDLQLFRPDPHLDPRERRVLSVGPAQIGWKGIQEVLEAVRLVKAARRDVRFIRVSNQPQMPDERAAGVIDEFHYAAGAREMATFYNRCDLLISATHEEEGHDLPAWEAVACGLPVVLTENRAHRALDPGREAVRFVPLRDAAAVAGAILEVLGDGSARSRMQAWGPRRVAAWGWDHVAGELEAVLRTIVEREGKRYPWVRPR